MARHAATSLLLIGTLLTAASGCTGSRFFGHFVSSLGHGVEPAPAKTSSPYRKDARLAVTWIGHATVLVQMDDRVVLTDPVLTTSVGQVSRRLVAPGLEAAALPSLDAVIVSHMHFDHLSVGTLEMIERKVRRLYVPSGGLVYVTSFDFDAVDLEPWETFEDRGMRITAVPVRHNGWRYGVDSAWMNAYSGYVLEYHGLTVFFGGDTGYDAAKFRAVSARFPHVDLALLPIAPMSPREMMRRNHMSPEEALDALVDLRAERLVPMHFATFIDSLDEPGDAKRVLDAEVARRGLGERVTVLAQGGQAVLLAR